MALGNDDNNEKKYWDPTVYSSYKMSNTEGIDPSALSIAFYRGMLKIAISPMKKNSDKISFDHENNIVVFLTHTKAKMLLNEVKYIMANPGTVSNGGVNTGSNGLISFSDGKELGVTGPCLIIRKISETEEITSSYVYEFKINYHHSIRNFDQSSASHEKFYYDNLEIEQFITLLEEFCVAMTGAVAYSVVEEEKYGASRTNTKIESIMKKLGIEYDKATYSKGGNSSNGSDKSTSMRSSTLDDIANNLEA